MLMYHNCHNHSFSSAECPKLDDEISRKVLADIARDHMKHWEHISPYLGLSRQKEIEISQNYPRDYARQRRECLEAWREAMKPGVCSYRALISAVEEAKDIDMAECVRTLCLP